MINIVIIEDEIPARKKLKRFLEELTEPVKISAEIDTVSEAIAFFEKGNSVDLVLSDIELLDGNAFEIYAQCKLQCPIIFITAYDTFWMDAFENNGIAYLLKPFSLEKFQKAWNKFILFKNDGTSSEILLSKLNKLIESTEQNRSYKKRFSINTTKGTHFVATENILFFEANEGVVFATDIASKKHLLTETTLKEIESQLDPLEFFRINRAAIVNKKFIERTERYAKNSIAIMLHGFEQKLVTSRSTTSSFREWIEK